jgi:hypothetical protein
MPPIKWKKGRGKLGVLAPLSGEWVAHADTPMGPVRCTRSLRPALGGAWMQADVRWEFAGKAYEERALFGIDREGRLGFWSFTSDGKQSHGVQVNASDVHADAIAFEAEMPAGTARMVYWPDPEEGFRWAVESKTKKGWNRFTEHHYTAAG